MKRHFSNEDMQMDRRHVESCSYLIIREIQIKTITRYHLTPVRMPMIKKTTNISVGENVKKRDPPTC